MKRTQLSALILVAMILSIAVGCKASNNSTSNMPADSTARTAEASVKKATLRFDDVTASSGISHQTISGFEAEIFGMIEFVGGGVGVIDIDLDGQFDLVFAGGGKFPDKQTLTGRPGTIYRAIEPFHFVDVTAIAGMDLSAWYNHSVTCDDLDADGFDDFIVSGFGRLQVLMNNGDGTFSDATEQSGLDDPQWSTAIGTADFDKDGLVDAYVAHYGNWSLQNNPICTLQLPGNPRGACSPTQFPGVNDKLFLRDAGGWFRDATAEANLDDGGRGLGVTCGDIDLDGDVDIYVANDEDRNFLYINDGQGKLKESAITWGCATDGSGTNQGSMGVAFGDFQNDLRPDIFVTNFAKELCALYSSRGRAGFKFSSVPSGVKLFGPSQVSWGTAFYDVDLDGAQDLFVVSGHVDRVSPDHLQKPTLLLNKDGVFQDVSQDVGGYFQEHWAARGLALFDADHDGRMDLVVSHLDQPSRVLRNNCNSEGHYLNIRLIGVRSNRNAIGAYAVLRAGAHQQLQLAVGGGSYMSTSQRVLCFSAAQETSLPAELELHWPSGEVSKVKVDGWDQQLIIVEPHVPGNAPVIVTN